MRTRSTSGQAARKAISTIESGNGFLGDLGSLSPRRGYSRLVSTAPILALVVCLLACGCATTREIRRGQAAAAAGRPILARDHYEAAARLSPTKLKDPEFIEKLRITRRDAGHAEGCQFARRKQWDAALREFAAALELEPGWPPALRSIEETRQWAATELHQQALRDADTGDLKRAGASVIRALTFVPDHAGALQARQSVKTHETDGTPATQHYRTARQHVAELRWQAALHALRDATAANPNHLPARALLHEAQTQAHKASRLFDQGISALEQKALKQAETALARSLDVSPHAGRTAERLKHVRSLLDQAESLAEQTREHLARKRWDDAIASAQATLQLWAAHPSAATLRADAAQGAAREAVRQGHKLLKQHACRRAEAEFRRALTYCPEDEAPREGLAEAASIRARTAEEKEAWGAALLWRMTAQRRHGRSDDDALIKNAKSHVLDRLQTYLALTIVGPEGREDPDSLDLSPELRHRLQGGLPSFVSLRPAQTTQGTPLPEYELRVDCLGINIKQEVTRREDRTHAYQIEHRYPNPEIQRTSDMIRSCERQEALLRNNLADSERRLRHFQEHTPRKQDAKHRTNGHSKDRPAHDTGPHTDTHDSPRHKNDVEHQRREQHFRREVERCRRDLDEERRELNMLRRRLAFLPRTIVEVHQKTWPYVRVTSRKTGRLVIHVRLYSQVTGVQLAEEIVDVKKQSQDGATQNPNPDIGLYLDPLTLQSDYAIRQSLLNAAAARVGEMAVDMVHESIRSQLEEKRDTVREQARVAPGRLEHEVNAILARQARGSTAAETELEHLREEVEEGAARDE